ncbi:MAG TPA: hypothetical protein VGE85_13980 [Terracidiphilus sp.]|jgi:hypothetical protein
MTEDRTTANSFFFAFCATGFIFARTVVVTGAARRMPAFQLLTLGTARTRLDSAIAEIGIVLCAEETRQV